MDKFKKELFQKRCSQTLDINLTPYVYNHGTLLILLLLNLIENAKKMRPTNGLMVRVSIPPTGDCEFEFYR